MVLVLALSLASFGTSLAAQSLRVEIDAEASEVSFVLGGNTHTVHGTFEITSGSVVLDPLTGSLSGRIVADAASGTAEKPKVVKRMHNEILEVSEFPAIVFRPERIELPFDGGAQTDVVGTFDIHGTSHTVTLPVDVVMDGDRVVATTVMDMPYVAWGMKDPSRLVFRSDKEVHLEIKLVGRVLPHDDAPDGH